MSVLALFGWRLSFPSLSPFFKRVSVTLMQPQERWEDAGEALAPWQYHLTENDYSYRSFVLELIKQKPLYFLRTLCCLN